MGHQKEYYRDPYGCTASIRHRSDGKWQLRVCIPTGKPIHSKSYTTRLGARIALGRLSEGMMKRRI